MTREEFNKSATACFISYEQYLAEVKQAEEFRTSEIEKVKQRLIDDGMQEDFAEDMSTKIFDAMVKAVSDYNTETLLNGGVGVKIDDGKEMTDLIERLNNIK